MKKIKYFVLTMMMLLAMTVMVYAEPDDAAPKGAVNFKANVPEGVKGSIEFKIYNKTMDIEKGITLSHFNGYEAFIMAEFGEYELTWVRFLNEKRIALDYTVTMDPFVIGRENPNGDWSWDIIINASPNTENVNETVKTELSGAIGNYLSGNNNKTETEKKGDNNSDPNTLIIPADNKYFPNMTLDEVKKWYTNEVRKFVSVANEKGLKNQFGQSYWFTDDPVSEYQRSIKVWAMYVYDKNERDIQSTLSSLKSNFYESSSPEARAFYEVTMKMRNFIKEYQEENNIYLNFTRWDVELDPDPETTEPDTEEKTTEEEYTTPGNVSTEEQITTNATNESSVRKKNKTVVDILKDSWLTITILIVVAVIGIIFGVKYKKSEE